MDDCLEVSVLNSKLPWLQHKTYRLQKTLLSKEEYYKKKSIHTVKKKKQKQKLKALSEVFIKEVSD